MTDAITATAGTGTSAQNLTEGTDDQAAAQATADKSKTTNDAPDNQDKGERTFTQDDLNRIVKNAEKTAVAAALKAEADKKAQADLTEAQREKQRADEAERLRQIAEQKVVDFAKRNAVTLAVANPKLMARDPKAIALLVNAEALEVEGEEVKGIDAELKRIKANHPALFFDTTVDGGARGDGGGTLDFNAEIRRKAGR